MNISAGLGVAVREFPLTSGFADYLLYADGKAIGVLEAKPEGHTLSGVETQSGKYLDGLPRGLPNYRLPLPFAYESTGAETHFTNALEPDARSREVFAFHRPEELIRLVDSIARCGSCCGRCRRWTRNVSGGSRWAAFKTSKRPWPPIGRAR